jgi:glycosyltransferase involved in cell wall biosynthesis
MTETTTKTILNYIGPMNRTGYGIASMGYANGIKRLCEEKASTFSYSIIGDVEAANQEVNSPINIHLVENMKIPPNIHAPSLIFWHFSDTGPRITQFKGQKVGISTFEVDDFTEKEIEGINSLDVVGTASKWGEEVLKNRFPDKPTFRAPHAVAYMLDDETPTVKKENPIPIWQKLLDKENVSDDTFIISSAGKYEKRKGHPELLDAALSFSDEKDILLITFWFNPFIENGYPFGEIHSRELEPVFTQNGIRLFKRGRVKVALMPPANTRVELHGALGRSHFFFSPSRGEGWDLPLFELMTFGMPCAATHVSAHTDYCTEENTLKIEAGNLVPSHDGRFFHGIGKWYDVSTSHVRDAIEKAMTFSEDERHDLSTAAIETARKYAWLESAKTLLSQLNLK